MIESKSLPKTVGQLSRETGLPQWRIRRTADALGVQIPRVGLYRVIPVEIEARLLEELQKTGKING